MPVHATLGDITHIVPADQLPAFGFGNMTKGVYDPNLDDKISEAQLLLSYATHSNTSDHTQGTDQGLDNGGANAVTAVQAKAAYTHSGTSHAPSNAQVNADITKAEIEAKLTGPISSHSHAGGSSPIWADKVIGCMGDGDPNDMLQMMLNNPINATPTNIAITVARCSFFRPPTNITVNTIRFFGVGATTGIYHIAIYQHSNLARLTGDLSPNTAAQAWGTAATGLNLTLTAGTLYFIAVSVDTTGTTAGIHCMSSTTGRIGILPTVWPGNLDVDLATPIVDPIGFCQFAVTAGVLPTTAPTLALQAAWTGGMPAIFLDNA